MSKRTVTAPNGVAILLMDSITSADADDAGRIVVAGSHGGISSGEFATRQQLAGCFLNDAGVGKDQAGIYALGMLESDNTPGATVGYESARIGDAQDHWDNGVISHVNETAAAMGVAPGMRVRDAAALL